MTKYYVVIDGPVGEIVAGPFDSIGVAIKEAESCRERAVYNVERFKAKRFDLHYAVMVYDIVWRSRSEDKDHGQRD
jgi:hypothetical protein